MTTEELRRWSEAMCQPVLVEHVDPLNCRGLKPEYRRRPEDEYQRAKKADALAPWLL